MEMHQLRYFVAVAEEENFTRAAEKCFVSQPSLSAQIIKLESELGAKLFNRLGRRVELTSAGVFFEKRARSILMEAENAQLEISEGEGEPRGRLRVGVTPTVGPYLLPPVLANCRERYPDLQIRVEESQRRLLMDSLVGGQLDVVISSYSGKVAHIEAEPVLQESLNLVVPRNHALADKQEISIQDFKDEPLILLGESLVLGEKVLELFGRNNFEPKIGAVCSQVSTAKALVHSGVGLSILPEMARETVSPYDVVFRTLISSRMTRLLFALTHEQRYLTSGAQAFLKTVREFVDERS
ncbi:MAG: LysR family hydrogen peroxide-inducible transcriptional activator [Candidatus Pelagisphaera sp.]|jgi:LysR family hydrogen peroxide-inducible transcriptional activator|tara:strand:- start:18 stop:908 length:891 start_codon:yes stop_codon:yes gene_type:complete